MSDIQERRTLNLSEVAQLLGVDRKVIAKEAKAGRLPFPVFRIATRWLVPYAAIKRIAGELSVPTDFVPERKTLRIDEVAELLGIARSTLYVHMRDDTFPFPVIRLGERMVVPYVVVEKLLAGEYIEPTWLAPQDEH